MRFSPRWCVTPEKSVKYITGYSVSHAFVETQYKETPAALCFRLRCPSREIECHILLPEGFEAKQVTIDGTSAAFRRSTAGKSVYVDFTILRPEQPQHDPARYRPQAALDIRVER